MSTYYFDSEGKMVRGRTITKWTKKYTFDENGVLIKLKFFQHFFFSKRYIYRKVF
ncbi:hypothetical protein [Butyrivibrio sp. MC2021]|uniref:hypothetical protein n=1 Tax=Butyrivibrio sp. MC2021 TaxID=1408306 RepID=UPI00211012D6